MSNVTVGSPTISQQDMEKYYYGINPTRHAEKAYQPNQGDRFPTLSTVPTRANASGFLILLVTTVRNQPIFGTGEAQVIDYDALLRYSGGAFPTPEVAQKLIAQHPEIVIDHVSDQTPHRTLIATHPNSRVTVRVLTGGYMAKVITYEDYVAGGGTM